MAWRLAVGSSDNDPHLALLDEAAGCAYFAAGSDRIEDAVDYREGTDLEPSMRKLVGLRKYSNITLKRGYTDDRSLWDWFENIRNGLADRRNMTIVLMNEERMPVMRWHAENAWINKIEGPRFEASGNEVAIESVELVHEGLTIEA